MRYRADHIAAATCSTLILVWFLLNVRPVGGGIPANLRGLHAVTIVVEQLDDAAASEQITSQMLEDQVLVTLRSKAPGLRYDPSVLPYLYVNLNLMTSESGYTGNLALQLNRPVEILLGVHRTGQQPTGRVGALAAVWDSAYTIRGGKGRAADQVRQVLDLLMEQFLADYFRANP